MDGPLPNPMSGSARIPFWLPEAGHLRLYDMAGRLLFGVAIGAGSGVWEVPGRLLPNGTYLIRLETCREEAACQLVIVR
jgi:hypothetical protein